MTSYTGKYKYFLHVWVHVYTYNLARFLVTFPALIVIMVKNTSKMFLFFI